MVTAVDDDRDTYQTANRTRFDQEAPSAALAASWRKQVRLACDFKLKQFDIDAYEALKFYNGDHSFLWDAKDPRSFAQLGHRLGNLGSPDCAFTWNIAALVVQLFGPTMYARNPFRQVNSREPIDIPQSLFIDPDLAAQLQQLQQKLFPQQPPGAPQPQQQAPGQPPQQPPPNPMVQQMMA